MQARAEDRAEHTFLIWAPFDAPAEKWTYADFHAEVCALAAGMKDRGVERGDVVLLHMENCPEFLLSWHACARLGAVVVTTNTRSSADEMEYFLDDCGATVAITQPKFESLVRDAGPKLEWVTVTDQRRRGDAGDAALGRGPALRNAARRCEERAAARCGASGRKQHPVHVRYDVSTEGRALDARERIVGRTDERPAHDAAAR